MFDRIAGVYDLMNTAMTAGLHHRWRARAADLARVGPGQPRARRRHRHRRPRARARAPGGPDGRGGRLRLRRGRCSTARARRPRRASRRRSGRASNGPTRWRCPTRTAPSTPPRSASGRATSTTFSGGLGEMARVVRPRRPGRRARDHHPHAPAAVASSTASGSTASCRRSAGSPALERPRAPGTRPRARCSIVGQPTPTCPTRSSASPDPAGSPASSTAPGSTEISYLLIAGRHRRDPRRYRAGRGGGRERRRAQHRPRAHSPAGDAGRARGDHGSAAARRCASGWRAPSAHLMRVTADAGEPLASTRTRPSPPAASACARCWWCWRPSRPAAPPAVARRARSACCARPSPSSWCTPRRSSTTT